MENKKQPIVPFYLEKGIKHPDQFFGLTKREYFAGLAMQGLLSCNTLPMTNGKEINTQHEIAIWCVDMADELLKQLENGK